MRAYKNAASCLQDFVQIVNTRATDQGNAARYAYFVDMAGPDWTEYVRWKTHELWNDKRLMERLRQAVRSNDGIIKEILDSIVLAGGSPSFNAKRRSEPQAAHRDALRETKVLGEGAVRRAERGA
jgi:hypothetical protein